MADDALEAIRNDLETIRAIMERYGVDEETAREMWNRAIDTLIKVREARKG
jgi:hypothetical protein